MARVSEVEIHDFPIHGVPSVEVKITISEYGPNSELPFVMLPEAHQKALRAYIEGEK